MIKKDPKLIKPEFRHNSSKRKQNSVLQRRIKDILRRSHTLGDSDDIDDLKSCITLLTETIEELDSEFNDLEQYASELEEWGEEWETVANDIDSYSIYPFYSYSAPHYCHKFVVPNEEIHSHNFCSYSQAKDLYEETGLCYVGYDQSAGVIFDVVNEKKWILCKIKNGY